MSWCANCHNKWDRMTLYPGGLISCSCTNCKAGKLMNCGRCKLVSYCSRECQQEHWHYSHKATCKKTLPGDRVQGNLIVSRISFAEDRFFKRMVCGNSVAREVLVTVYNALTVFWSRYDEVSNLERELFPDIGILPICRGEGVEGWIGDYLHYIIYLVAVLKGWCMIKP